MKKIKLSVLTLVLVFVGATVFVACSNDVDKAMANDPSVVSQTIKTAQSSVTTNTEILETSVSQPTNTVQPIQNTQSRLLTDKDTLIMADPDYLFILNARNDFADRLAGSNLTEPEITELINQQQYTELYYAAGYSDEEMAVTIESVSERGRTLIARYDLTSNPNPSVDPQPLVGVIKNIRTTGESAKRAQCQSVQFAVCCVLGTEAGPLFPAAGYLCYCSYCSGPVHDAICW